jgi:hypothetical protein
MLAPQASQRWAVVAPGHDQAGDRRAIEFATLNNPIGLVFVRGQPDHKEFAAGHAQTRFEPEDQIGQIFGRQLEGRSIRQESVSNGAGLGCAGMR